MINRLPQFLTLIALTGSMMAGSIGEQVNPPNAAAQPQLRIGTVLSDPPATAQTAWVQIFDGGDPVEFPFQTGYVPVAGDSVNVLLLGGANSAGIILGGRAGQSGNMVLNGNFQRAPALEVPPTNEPPYHWTRYPASGTAAVLCQVPYQSAMALTMDMSGSAIGDTYAYSAAIPVTPGATYEIRSMGHITTFLGSAVTIQTRIAWFTQADDVYPNFASENQVGTDTIGAAASSDIYHTLDITAPAGATHARIALRTNHTAGGGGNMYWNEIVMLRQ